MVQIADAMSPLVLAPGELAPSRRLYVMLRGTCMYGRRLISKGGLSWGDDVILENPANFISHLARALTYVDMTALSRDALLRIVGVYPNSEQRLNRHTVLLALRRSIISHAKALVRHVEEGGSIADYASKPGTLTFVSKVEEASRSAMPSTQQESMSIALSLDKSVIDQRVGTEAVSYTHLTLPTICSV